MQRLLVATDFSASADRALRRAFLLVRQTGAELTLLHVVEPDDDTAGSEAEARLAELQETLAQVDGIAAAVRVSAGDFCGTVAAAAAELAADLIVIGASTHPPLRSTLTGSNTERLVRGCDRPVLVCAGLPSSDYRHILVATDFSEPSRAALGAVPALRLADFAEVSVTHVFETAMPSFNAAAGSIREQTERWIAAERAVADRHLDELLSPLGLVSARRIIVPNESTPARTLLGVAHDAHAELIVAGCSGGSPFKQRLLGSVLTELLKQTAVDVLVVPALTGQQPEMAGGGE